ncbi:MAG: rRNA (cytidine-2'-O-)-methyltransferase, partial [Alphaproteobacteria bacterium]|nr:rRNA (cytidine-2'-O-)-methyltransferase [Alphaproteobacteria bacterium]
TGTASEIINIFNQKEPKGEMVFMIAPPSEKEFAQLDLDVLIRQKLQQLPLKTAVKELVSEYKLNKNEVYTRALELKNENN